MGRRNRERIQAIQEGRARSVRQRRDDLMHEVVKLATIELFYSGEYSDTLAGESTDIIVKAMIEILPHALRAVGRAQFSVTDLTRDKDFREMACRMIMGILARGQEQFRFADRKGEMWTVRKRKRKISLSGSWRMCAWCGLPVYQTQSTRQRCCTQDCRWALYRREKRDERLTGEEIEDRAITLALSPLRAIVEKPAEELARW